MDGNIDTTPPFLKLLSPRQKASADAARKVEQEARGWLDALAGHAGYRDPAEGKAASARKPIREVLFDDAFAFGSTSRSS